MPARSVEYAFRSVAYTSMRLVADAPLMRVTGKDLMIARGIAAKSIQEMEDNIVDFLEQSMVKDSGKRMRMPVESIQECAHYALAGIHMGFKVRADLAQQNKEKAVHGLGHDALTLLANYAGALHQYTGQRMYRGGGVPFTLFMLAPMMAMAAVKAESELALMSAKGVGPGFVPPVASEARPVLSVVK